MAKQIVTERCIHIESNYKNKINISAESAVKVAISIIADK